MLHSLLVSAMVVAGVGLGHFFCCRGVCAPGERGSAEAQAEDRRSVSGAQKGAAGAWTKAGEQGRGALPRSCGTGMRETWASGPLSALCLSAPCAAARRCGPGRGGDGGAGRGFLRWGMPRRGAHRRTAAPLPFSRLLSPPLTLGEYLVLTPSPPQSLTASHPLHPGPVCPSLGLHPPGRAKGSEVGLSTVRGRESIVLTPLFQGILHPHHNPLSKVGAHLSSPLPTTLAKIPSPPLSLQGQLPVPLWRWVSRSHFFREEGQRRSGSSLPLLHPKVHSTLSPTYTIGPQLEGRKTPILAY